VQNILDAAAATTHAVDESAPPRATRGSGPAAFASARTLGSALLMFVVVLSLAKLAQSQLSARLTGIDDANIYFKYAKNIAAGEGIVWNPGGEHVEGGTSFLWTLVCALAFALGSQPESGLLWINIVVLTGALTVWLLALFALTDALPGWRRHAASAALASAFCLWLVASPAYLVWNTITLVDTGLWSAGLLFVAVCSVRFLAEPEVEGTAWALGAALVVVTWARPEGFALGVGILALIGGSLCSRCGTADTVREALATARIPAAALFLATTFLFLFRKAYFGFWLPNTYYAKVGGDPIYNLEQGYAYLQSFMEAYPAMGWLLGAAVLCLLAWLWALWVRLPATSGPARFSFDLGGISAATFLFGVMSTIYVGGDHFGGWRFLQPYWPLGFSIACLSPLMLVGVLAGKMLDPSPRALLAALSISLPLGALSLGLSPVSWQDLANTSRVKYEFVIAEAGRQTGKDLTEIFTGTGDALPSVGIIASGGIGLSYAGFSYDLLGLNNVAMAHASRDRIGVPKNHGAFNAKTFYEQAPQVVIVSTYGCSSSRPPHYPIGDTFTGTVLRHIDQEPHFKQLYAPVLLTTPRLAARDVAYCEFMRRDYLAEISGKIAVRALL
jgi:arabinofuranosyltransferase